MEAICENVYTVKINSTCHFPELNMSKINHRLRQQRSRDGDDCNLRQGDERVHREHADAAGSEVLDHERSRPRQAHCRLRKADCRWQE